MNYFIAILVAIIITECIIRLPIKSTIAAIISNVNKPFAVIRSKYISDHWKERAILQYSYIIFVQTIKLAGFLVLIASPVIVASIVYNKFFAFAASIKGMAFISIVLFSLYKVRSSSNSTDYGLLSKILHYIALDKTIICEASFDIEQIIHKHDYSGIVNQKHVFITGLARSGTTLLMRRFYTSMQYRTLTYSNMPFILMPNSWTKISSVSRKDSMKTERAHKDGILVDYDSPEAFEEVFWRTYSGQQYIKPDKLIPI